MLSDARFARYVLIALSLAVVFIGLGKVTDVLLLGFGGVLFAIAIRAGGEMLARRLPVSARMGSVIVVLALVAGLVLLFKVVGGEVGRQAGELQQQLPDAIAKARALLDASGPGRALLSLLDGATNEGVSAAGAMKAASATFGVLSDLFIVLLLALYLGFSPRTYVKSAVNLVPPAHRDEARQAAHNSGQALRRWLMGQGLSMLCVGVLTGVGLWLVGVPNAAILGLIAGLFEFVPVIGPFAAAVPGVLFAMVAGPTTALYAAGVYFAVQQLEGALIMPMAQRWAVNLPPALGLLAVVVFGVLFGVPGLLFATPLTVVIMVLVKQFYLDRMEPAASGQPSGSDTSMPAERGRFDRAE